MRSTEQQVIDHQVTKPAEVGAPEEEAVGVKKGGAVNGARRRKHQRCRLALSHHGAPTAHGAVVCAARDGGESSLAIREKKAGEGILGVSPSVLEEHDSRWTLWISLVPHAGEQRGGYRDRPATVEGNSRHVN